MEGKGELPQLRQEGQHCRGVFMQKREEGVVKKNWLLLDSQSMVDQVANPVLLKNIRRRSAR